MYKDKKLLFCGISEKIEAEIKKHLDNTQLISEFCDLNDTEAFIESFQPDMLFAAVSAAMKDYENQITELKEISKSFQKQLSVIVNRSEEDLYYFLLKNEIAKIITFPMSKKSFISLIDKFLSTEDSAEETDFISPQKSFSEKDNSLISNLVIQNRIVKNNLRNRINLETKKNKIIHSETINSHRLIEKKLWNAYDNGYFRLFYQPVIDLNSGKLSGFEALIRLLHPEEGLIPPDSFIHVAEKSAIIFPLGLWIIEEAGRQINLKRNGFLKLLKTEWTDLTR